MAYRKPEPGDWVEYRRNAVAKWERKQIVTHLPGRGGDATLTPRDGANYTVRHYSKEDSEDPEWSESGYGREEYQWRWPGLPEAVTEKGLEVPDSAQLCTSGSCGRCFGCELHAADIYMGDKAVPGWPDVSIPMALRCTAHPGETTTLTFTHLDEGCQCAWHTVAMGFTKEGLPNEGNSRQSLRDATHAVQDKLKDFGWVRGVETTLEQLGTVEQTPLTESEVPMTLPRHVAQIPIPSSLELCPTGICGTCFGCRVDDAHQLVSKITWPNQSIPLALRAAYDETKTGNYALRVPLTHEAPVDGECGCLWHTAARSLSVKTLDGLAQGKKDKLRKDMRVSLQGIITRLKAMEWARGQHTTGGNWIRIEDSSSYATTATEGRETTVDKEDTTTETANGTAATLIERLAGEVPLDRVKAGLYISIGDQIIDGARKMACTILTQDIKKKKKRKKAMEGIKFVLETKAGEVALRGVVQMGIRNLPFGSEAHRTAIADHMANQAAAIPMNWAMSLVTGPGLEMFKAWMESDETIQESFKALDAISSKEKVEIEDAEIIEDDMDVEVGDTETHVNVMAR